MKDVKEQIIDEIVASMATRLDKTDLSILLYNASTILKDIKLEAENNAIRTIDKSNDYDILNYFLSCKKLKGCTIGTIIRYGDVLKRFIAYLPKSILSATTNDIRCFLVLCSKTMCNTSVDGFRLCINSFFSWAVEEEILEKNPCGKIDRIKNEKKVVKVISQREVVRLKDYCDDWRELVFIDLLDSCGLRCMEIPNIKVSDIDFNRHTVKIYGKGNKQREVVLSDECLEHIDRYLQERCMKNINSDYLICRNRKNESGLNSPLQKNSISKMMRNIKKRAGVQDAHIHGMRRKFATDLSKRGMNVFSIQKLMGHASLSTTQIYVNTPYDNIINEYNIYKN